MKNERFQPEGAEYRAATMEVSEIRMDRQDDGSDPKIVGYAARFNSLSHDLGGFRERIQPGAFSRALQEGQDVRALVDHDPGRIIGRSSSGTLRMLEDSDGLRVEIDPADTTAGRDIMESISRGDVTGMSFGFTVRDDEWNIEDGANIRTLRDMDLFDVSVVTFPAYEQTEVALRSLSQFQADTNAVEEDIRRADATATRKAKIRLAETD
jgi:HK97 family phage prohead protease